MDKRTLLALALMALVLVGMPILFPGTRRPVSPASDTSAPSAAIPPAATVPATRVESVEAAAPKRQARAPESRALPADTTTVSNPQMRQVLAAPGAAPLAAELVDYRDLRPGSAGPMVVRQLSGPLLSYRLVLGDAVVDLDTVPFTIRREDRSAVFEATNPAVTIRYNLADSGYLTQVRGSVANAPPNSRLLVDLPGQLRTAEADTLDDIRHFAFAFKVKGHDVTSIPFSKLDTAVARTDTGAMTWVAARDKYWLVALLQPRGDTSQPAFVESRMKGGSRVGRTTANASGTAAQPIRNGSFAFDLYVGPQSWAQLHALDDDLENVNPYAGWLHGIVQPFATGVMRALLWLKQTFKVNYGWVLVIFGVAVRLLLWPLNQRAMRTSIQMQRLQPELTETQRKYKNDPEKQREALVKVYKAHNMSPLSPMLGCLPMLLPMPVLFALYFVFQNTIEFRGVQFLWLPDLALSDPYFITPVVMGASMFLLSWIGMKSAPPNPQAKMMSYLMPGMFTFMFLKFASGLNLYYAVQNLAALPQQWLIAKERQRSGASTGPAPSKR
jgi:YidC/Oxa1 family membrane protein insertase